MHLWYQMIINTDVALSIVLVDVVLERWETQHITIFVVTIVLRMLLDSVVGQVDEGVVNILQVNSKLGTRCTQITFLEEE